MQQGDRYSLRTAGPDDEASVSALLKACYSTFSPRVYDRSVLDKSLPVMTAANPTLLRSGNFLIAETPAGRAVGCGGWSLEWPGTGEIVPGEAHIRQYAVHPDWIRRGIASSINQRCFAAAADRKIEMIHCYAALGSEAFYEKLGFETIGRKVLELPRQVSIPVVHYRCPVSAISRAGL